MKTKLVNLLVLITLNLTLIISGCQKKTKQPQQWIVQYENGNFSNYIKQLPEEKMVEIFNSIKNGSNQDSKKRMTRELVKQWVLIHPKNCLNHLEATFNRNSATTNTGIAVALDIWYNSAPKECLQYVKNICYNKANWRAFCYNKTLTLLINKNNQLALQWVEQPDPYRHYLITSLVEEHAHEFTYNTLAKWLSQFQKSEDEIAAATKDFIHKYSNYKSKELLTWLDTLNISGQLKLTAWKTAATRLSEHLPDKIIKYFNNKSKVHSIISHSNSIEAAYESLLIDLLTGITHSNRPHITFHNLNVIHNPQERFNLQKYYYYMANRYNFPGVWKNHDNVPKLLRHNFSYAAPPSSPSPDIELFVKPRNKITPVENDQSWIYSFQDNTAKTFEIKCHKTTPQKAIFISNNNLKINIQQNIINFSLLQGETLTILLPGDRKISIHN